MSIHDKLKRLEDLRRESEQGGGDKRIAAQHARGKLYPGGARPWDWNETGTSHIPGVQPADVQEILDRGVEVLVIGRGYLGHLQVCPETRALLQERKVELHVLQTEVAVALYNKLRRTRHVGGIFHSTC